MILAKCNEGYGSVSDKEMRAAIQPEGTRGAFDGIVAGLSCFTKTRRAARQNASSLATYFAHPNGST
jgi:hypothetical protein